MADYNSTNNTTGGEHRQANRVATRLPVECRMESVHRLSMIGLCENISGLGMKMSIDRPILPGVKVSVLLHMTDNGLPVHAEGAVVWCAKPSVGKWNVGLKFTNIHNKVDFEESLCKKMFESNMEHR